MNIVSVLLEEGARSAKAPALRAGSRILTYEELFEQVLALASGLSSSGIEPGDRVGVALPNGAAFGIAYLAVQACGAVVVPQSVLLRPREWMEVAEDSGLKLQIVDERFARLIAEAAQARGVQLLVAGPAEGPFRHVRVRALRLPQDRRPMDPAAMPYTAALDGYYHGAILTHGSLLANARACVSAWQVNTEDRIAAFLPLYHGFGTMTAFLTPLLAGAQSVLLEKFSPAEAASTCAEHRPTIFPGVPTMFAQMLGEGLLRGEAVASVRNFTCGGAALPAALYDRALAGGVELLQGYGLTEHSPVVSVNRSAALHRKGSVGTPLPGVEVAIEAGEVLLRGPSVMAGYHKAPELTARTIVGGWLHTRDLGYLDEGGYLHLTGRLLPMAIVGGFNVYPEELRRVLLTHPGLEDVEIRAEPDPVYGEAVVASVRGKGEASVTAEELQSWCRRQFSAYKIPRRFEVTGGGGSAPEPLPGA